MGTKKTLGSIQCTDVPTSSCVRGVEILPQDLYEEKKFKGTMIELCMINTDICYFNIS